MKLLRCIMAGALILTSSVSIHAQSRPKLFFREDWKEIAAALPVTQEHVSNSDLVLALYGPARGSIKKSNHPEIPNDPYYIWSGECRANWALTLRHRHQAVDMSGNASIRIRSRQSGFRELRIIIKLADGTWLVADKETGYTEDWTERELRFADLRWRKLNIELVAEGAWVDNPDLKQVDEIGFTDLMSGGGTPASSRVDWLEVYGTPVVRK